MSGTCIAKNGGRICGAPTSDRGRDVLCEMHLLLHQSGRHVEPAKSARDDQRKAFDLLKVDREKARALLFSPQAVSVFALTATLFLVEIVRMSVLQVPMSISMVGFDTLGAAFRNAGPVLAIVGAILIVLLIVSAAMVAVIYLLYISYLASVLVAAISESGLFRFVFGLLAFPKRVSILWFQFKGDTRRASRARTWLEAAFPALRRERRRAQNKLNSVQKRARKSLSKRRDQMLLMLSWLWRTLTSLRDNSNLSRIVRFTVAAVVLAATVATSGYFATKFNDRLKAASGKSLAETACGTPSSAKDLWAMLKDQLIHPCPETGRLTIATRVPYDAVHLSGDARLDNASGAGFRTEDIFYIGDFGEWAFVARMADASQRLLIRRSAILEFAQFDAMKPVTGQPQDVPWAGSAVMDAIHVRSHMESAATLARLGSLDDAHQSTAQKLARTQDMFVRFLVSAHDPQRHESSELHEKIAMLEKRFARQTQDLERIRRALNEVAISDAGQTVRLRSLDQTVYTLRRGAEARFDRLNQRIDGYFQLANNVRYFDDFGRVMQDGVPVRASGIVNDLARRFGPRFLAACIEDRNRVGFVDFAEGRAERKPDGRLALIADQVAERLKRLPQDTPIVMVLRGGASYTGNPERNIRLSEKRAEWTQRKLLASLGARAQTPPAESETLSRRIDLVAFGVGERLDHTHESSRAVEVFLCPARPVDQPTISAQFSGADPLLTSRAAPQPGSDF